MSRKPVGMMSLPGFEDMNLPICPGCKRPSAIVGQWAPEPSAAYLCRDCTLRYPPPDVFTPAKNSIGVGLQQDMSYAPERQQYHVRSQVLEELNKGCRHTLDDVAIDAYGNDCLPCMGDDDLFGMNAYGVSGMGFQRPIEVIFERTRTCRRCRNRLLYVVSQRQQTATWIARHRDGTSTARTVGLPICHDCGRVHDRVNSISGDPATYCQECEDEHHVQSLWIHRNGVFGNDDVEGVMDRLEKAFPELFERDVLPRRWFELRLEEKLKEMNSHE